MGSGAVRADSEDRRAGSLQGTEVVAEIARFLRASRGIVLRIKVDDGPFVAQRFERDVLARLVLRLKSGAFVSTAISVM